MENMGLGLQVTVMGMGAVFLSLAALMYILTWFEKLFAQPKKPAVQQEISVAQEVIDLTEKHAPGHMDDGELVAIITAAVTMMMAQEQGYTPKIQITSIEQTSDAWRMRGRNNLLN